MENYFFTFAFTYIGKMRKIRAKVKTKFLPILTISNVNTPCFFILFYFIRHIISSLIYREITEKFIYIGSSINVEIT